MLICFALVSSVGHIGKRIGKLWYMPVLAGAGKVPGACQGKFYSQWGAGVL
ncbi:MAG: hypothetical protein AB7U70_15595 [Acinetobacter sp.]